ncbi:hypothetical protein [Streptomyces sp. NPDC005407]|uniref:hypothetical protein n=1 Tax=Streptomyces sp. NPDC005407 TaxID=3155340 RepID=UPI00339E4BC1
MTEAAKRFDPSLWQMTEANEANWDARTPVHLVSTSRVRRWPRPRPRRGRGAIRRLLAGH